MPCYSRSRPLPRAPRRELASAAIGVTRAANANKVSGPRGRARNIATTRAASTAARRTKTAALDIRFPFLGTCQLRSPRERVAEGARDPMAVGVAVARPILCPPRNGSSIPPSANPESTAEIPKPWILARYRNIQGLDEFRRPPRATPITSRRHAGRRRAVNGVQQPYRRARQDHCPSALGVASAQTEAALTGHLHRLHLVPNAPDVRREGWRPRSESGRTGAAVMSPMDRRQNRNVNYLAFLRRRRTTPSRPPRLPSQATSKRQTSAPGIPRKIGKDSGESRTIPLQPSDQKVSLTTQSPGLPPEALRLRN